jgi:hypothetical protein
VLVISPDHTPESGRLAGPFDLFGALASGAPQPPSLERFEVAHSRAISTPKA